MVQGCPDVPTVECNIGETVCQGETFPNGCRNPDFCVPPSTGVDGIVCPGQCPVNCESGNVHCEGIHDLNGCQQAASCEPESCTYGIDGAVVTSR